MLKELSKRTYNKKKTGYEARKNDLNMSKSFDILIKNNEDLHKAINTQKIPNIKKDLTNFSNFLDRSDYTSNYNPRSNLRSYYDSNNLRDISSEMKSTIDQSNRQSRPTKSADKYKTILSNKNIQRSNSAAKLKDDRREVLKKSCTSENQNMIKEIKLNGFEQYRQLIDERLGQKAKLESTIHSLHKQVNYVNYQKRDLGTVYTRASNEINQSNMLANRSQREIFYMNKELTECKQTIPELRNELKNKQTETKMIGIIIDDENKQIDLLTDDIRKLNKKISDVEKEKENFRNGALLLKKHIGVLKDKIRNEEEKSREFISNVSMVLDKKMLLSKYKK